MNAPMKNAFDEYEKILDLLPKVRALSPTAAAETARAWHSFAQLDLTAVRTKTQEWTRGGLSSHSPMEGPRGDRGTNARHRLDDVDAWLAGIWQTMAADLKSAREDLERALAAQSILELLL